MLTIIPRTNRAGTKSWHGRQARADERLRAPSRASDELDSAGRSRLRVARRAAGTFAIQGVLAGRLKSRLGLRRRAIYVWFMRAQLSGLLAMMLSCFVVSAADAVKEKDGGKELFNGKDLSGWKVTEFG